MAIRTWFENMSNERLELEKYSCEVRLKNLPPSNEVWDRQMSVGSLTMKIKCIQKELNERAIEGILLGDDE